MTDKPKTHVFFDTQFGAQFYFTSSPMKRLLIQEAISGEVGVIWGMVRLFEPGRASQVLILGQAWGKVSPIFGKIGDYISFLWKRKNTQWRVSVSLLRDISILQYPLNCKCRRGFFM